MGCLFSFQVFWALTTPGGVMRTQINNSSRHSRPINSSSKVMYNIYGYIKSIHQHMCTGQNILYVFISPPGVLSLQCYESSYQITNCMREHNDLCLDSSVCVLSCLRCPCPPAEPQRLRAYQAKCWRASIKRAERACPPLNQQRGHVWIKKPPRVCMWETHCRRMKTEMPGLSGRKRYLWGGNDQSDIHHTSPAFDFMQSFHVQANIIWVMETQMSSISAWE